MAVNNKSDFWLFLESPPLSTVRFNQTITWSSNRVPQQSVVRQKKLASSPVLEKGKALHWVMTAISCPQVQAVNGSRCRDQGVSQFDAVAGRLLPDKNPGRVE
jgi:hypothetical protein